MKTLKNKSFIRPKCTTLTKTKFHLGDLVPAIIGRDEGNLIYLYASNKPIQEPSYEILQKTLPTEFLRHVFFPPHD